MPNQMISSLETPEERAIKRHEIFMESRVFEPLSPQSVKVFIDRNRLKNGGYPAFELFFDVGLSSSKNNSRRLINQGGAYVNGERVKGFDQKVTFTDVVEDQIVLRVGKKRYLTVYLKD